MTKKDIRQYRDLLKERDKLEARIRNREKRAAKVPIVKDKVQASMDEWPYIETHVEVEAPEPRQYSMIQKDLILLREMEKKVDQEIADLDRFIASIPESRDRQIITAVFVDGKKQKDAGIEFDLSESAVSKIISKILQDFN